MIMTRQELEARMIQVISRCTDEWLAVHAEKLFSDSDVTLLDDGRYEVIQHVGRIR